MQSSTLWPAQIAHCGRVVIDIRCVRAPLAVGPCIRRAAALPAVVAAAGAPRSSSGGRRLTRFSAAPSPADNSDAAAASTQAAAGEPPVSGDVTRSVQGNEDNEEQVAVEALDPDKTLIITPDDVVAVAKEDLKEQWRALRAAALGRFDGDGTGSAPTSVAERLGQLASGALLGGWSEGGRRQGSAADGGTKSTPKPWEVAAAEAAAAAAAEAGASTSYAAAAPVAAGRRQQEEGPLEVVEARVVVDDGGDSTSTTTTNSTNGSSSSSEVMDPAAGAEAPQEQAQQQQLEEGGRYDDADEDGDGFDMDRVAAYQVPVTSVLTLVMGAVAVAQWWPVLSDVWWGLTNGQAKEVAWQMASAFPDTAATQALQMVRCRGI